MTIWLTRCFQPGRWSDGVSAPRGVSYFCRVCSHQTMAARLAARAATSTLSQSGTGAPFSVISRLAMNRSNCGSAISHSTTIARRVKGFTVFTRITRPRGANEVPGLLWLSSPRPLAANSVRLRKETVRRRTAPVSDSCRCRTETVPDGTLGYHCHVSTGPPLAITTPPNGSYARSVLSRPRNRPVIISVPWELVGLRLGGTDLGLRMAAPGTLSSSS
jgi:hypothetical protein